MTAYTVMRAVLSGARAVVITPKYTMVLRRETDVNGDSYVCANNERVVYLTELSETLNQTGVTVSLSPDLGAP
jgi:hypothetical protein